MLRAGTEDFFYELEAKLRTILNEPYDSYYAYVTMIGYYLYYGIRDRSLFTGRGGWRF